MPKEKKIKMSNEDAKFYFILLASYLEQEDGFSNTWDRFEEEIINSRRFFPESEVLIEIEKNAESATTILKKDKELFRARIFDKNPNVKFIEKYKDVLAENGIEFDTIKDELALGSSSFDMIISLLQFTDETLVTDDDLKYKLEAMRRYKASRFKGYNAKESLPPEDDVPSGRANPNLIRYLYLCEDSETPIYEVKPTIGQTVSLAKLKLNRDVKLYDFTLKNDGISLSLFSLIGKKFSMPNYGDVNRYLPTQYIAEKIREMGFDGIRFKSSLNHNGINIVLFNVEDCSVMSSNLLEIASINIDIKTPNIYEEVENLKTRVNQWFKFLYDKT